jgi:methylenetetrahydrofolate dehydrogenase (NADP+) / methenyltetrahydrofolate cyclohydrolase
MAAKILDGRALAQEIKNSLKAQIANRIEQGLAQPRLDVILVGSDPASEIYVGHKQRACAAVGIESVSHHLDADIAEQELLTLIQQLNNNPACNGILLQLPLPDHIDADKLIEAIAIDKDVDGFHPFNVGRLALRQPYLQPCTPKGIMTLINSSQKNIAGLNATIVGASNIVGRPMALELLLAKCTITVCHRFTQNLSQHVQSADLLVSAIGNTGIIQSDWIKPGAIVIDVGIHRLSNGEITGDIDFDTAVKRASWITPVPGGVGPMTVASLLENTLLAADKQAQKASA